MRLKMNLLSTMATIMLCGTAWTETVTFPTLKPSANMIIDGYLNEAVWKDAFHTGIFQGIDTSNPITRKAEAFAFCDDKNLYLGFRCEKHPDDTETDSPNVFVSDEVEFMLDAGCTGKRSQIAVTPLGKTYRVGICRPFQFGVQRGEKQWTAEFKVPYTSLELSLNKPLQPFWRIHLGRSNGPLKEYSAWAKFHDTFHEFEKHHIVNGIPAPLKEIQTIQFNAQSKPTELVLSRQLFDTHTTLEFMFNVNTKKSMKNFFVEATVFNAQNSIIKKHTFKPVYFKNKWQFDINGLAEGRYRLNILLLDAEGKEIDQQTASFWKIPTLKNLPKNHLTIKNQNAYLNGKFFFPIVIWQWTYNISNNEKERAAQIPKGADWYYQEQDVFLKDIKEHGFNTLYCDGATYVDQDPEMLRGNILSWEWFTPWAAKRMGLTWERTVEHVQKYGLWLIPESPYIRRDINDDRIDLFVKQILKYRDCDAVIAWSMADETDADIEGNLHRKALYHAIDPYRPVWLNVITALYENADASDIFSSDPYPIPHSPVTWVSSKGDQLEKATHKKPWQTRWMWIQNFGDEGDWTRPPTPEELQQMTTMALNHGIKGLAYFTYVPQWRRALGKRQNPAAWEALKTINAHTTELAPMYCLGERLFVGRQEKIDLAIIRYKGALTVSAVNITPEAQVGVITLPTDVNVDSGEVLYENRKVTIHDGKITEDFEPCAVHIYRFPIR